MGGTDERYRQGETYHATTEEKVTKGVGVVGKIWLPRSLKLFAEVGKIEQRDYIGNLIENGEMNITQKQLYDDYIKARKLDERG